MHTVCIKVWLVIDPTAQFHRVAKHTNLLSTEYLCLVKIGYQPIPIVIYIASNWFSAQFCLEDEFAKQYILPQGNRGSASGLYEIQGLKKHNYMCIRRVI